MGMFAARGLALVRMAFGLYFLLAAWKKLAAHWPGDGGPIVAFIQSNAGGTEPFYRPFLQNVVVPHAGLFAGLVTFGEWVAGLSLLCGALTRLGALLSMGLVLNYMLTKGLPALVVGPIVSTDWLFFTAGLACLIGSAGLVWGLDGAFAHRLSAHPLTRWLAGLPGPGAASPAAGYPPQPPRPALHEGVSR